MEQETFVNLNVKNLSEQVKVTIPEQTISAQINQSKITIPFQIKIEQSSSERGKNEPKVQYFVDIIISFRYKQFFI